MALYSFRQKIIVFPKEYSTDHCIPNRNSLSPQVTYIHQHRQATPASEKNIMHNFP